MAGAKAVASIFAGDFSKSNQVAEWLAPFKKPLVFTNGCFDILHRGHITYLAQAAELGSSLIVGVNSDASVKSLGKGDDRPLNNLEDRMALLAALRMVDGVIAFEQPTPLELILALRPDVLVKGGDWKPADIVGANEVESWGGNVHSIAFQFDRSTTQLLEKIRQD